MELLSSIFGRGAYLPHGYCFTWTPALLWSMVGADLLIAASYFSIPVAIVTFVRQRRSQTITGLAWLFSAFIFACGLTHVMDVWTIWKADYGLQALSKTLTAVISVVTAVALWRLLPRLLQIPTVAQLQSLVKSLEVEVAKRESAETQLAHSQQNLSIALASIGAAFISADREGRVVIVNTVAEKITGWSEQEARGQSIWQVFRREDRPTDYEARNPVDIMMEQGVTVESAFDVVALSRNGVRTPVEVKAALTHAGDGTVRGFAMVFRDRSDLVRAESEAKRLAAIVESSEDAIIGKTIEGVITTWNTGAETLFGYTASEAIGQPMLMLVPPERATEEPSILSRIARGESIEHFETERVRKDGRRIHISATISPVRNESGQIVGASKIARNITERRLGQSRLQAQLDRLSLMDSITSAIGQRQDLRSIYQVVIRSLEENLPADFCCICSHDAADNSLTVVQVGVGSAALAMELAINPKSRIAIDQNGLARCVGGELVYEGDTSANASPFPQRLAQAGLHSLVMAPLRSESRVFGILVAARRQPDAFSSPDCEFVRQLSAHVALAAHQAQIFSALQQAYEELRQTQQAVMQQERLRALGQMASGIAHDINNAISPILLYTETLLEREPHLSERGKGYLQTIARSIDDVAATVARLREFYRQREPQLALVRMELNPLLNQVAELTRARWRDMELQRGIVVHLVIEPAANLPAVRGIESEIREALTNLVLNAIDAMPDGGTLTLRTRVAPWSDTNAAPCVVVEVTDTGVGMDEDTRRRCLEPFFTTKGERGTGLGLAMVYGIAQRHGAEITVTSLPGAGTTIRLSFPIPAESDSGSNLLIHPERLASPLRVLVIDDDPIVLKSLCDTLEADGHSVVTANGGRAGIDAFLAARTTANPFQVVFTDLGMPYVDGRQVASEIKQASPQTPIILVTGWGQRLIVDADVPPYVDRVLAKPPKLRELRLALSEVVQEGSGAT